MRCGSLCGGRRSSTRGASPRLRRDGAGLLEQGDRLNEMLKGSLSVCAVGGVNTALRAQLLLLTGIFLMRLKIFLYICCD